MDVILLNSGPQDLGKISPYRTLGAYKIAHYTRAAGYNTQVIDHAMFLSEEQLRNCLLKFVTNDTLVIGVSTTFMRDPARPFNEGSLPAHIIQALNYISDQFPNVKLIFGGYSTFLVTYTRSIDFVKNPYAVIMEYGEDTFVEILDHLRGKGPEPKWTIAKVSSVGPYKKMIRQFAGPTVVKFNIETDAFRFTANDAIMPNETLPIEISRGCIFKCKFCNHLLLGRGKLDYLRDFELVRQEMMNNYEQWGTTNYYVICDTFNDTEYKMQAWHKMVMSLPFKIHWTSYLRADLLHRFPDVPYMLVETGLFSCFHGIETFGERASQVIGKGWSGKSAQEFLPKLYHDIWKKEVFQTLSFIVGLPGDTADSIMESAKWFNDNKMYSVAWHTLGLSSSAVKNASEFERNAANYGYEFISPGTWKNENWTTQSAAEFVTKKLGPLNRPFNARYGSWQIMQLKQMGYEREAFLKENNNKWSSREQLVRGQSFIDQYVTKLLSW
jgi:hypothetical protein